MVRTELEKGAEPSNPKCEQTHTAQMRPAGMVACVPLITE